MDRHAGAIASICVRRMQRISKHLIRDNANLLIIQTGRDLKHVYNDHVNTDMSYENFCELCHCCWQQKYGFVVTD